MRTRKRRKRKAMTAGTINLRRRKRKQMTEGTISQRRKLPRMRKCLWRELSVRNLIFVSLCTPSSHLLFLPSNTSDVPGKWTRIAWHKLIKDTFLENPDGGEMVKDDPNTYFQLHWKHFECALLRPLAFAYSRGRSKIAM